MSASLKTVDLSIVVAADSTVVFTTQIPVAAAVPDTPNVATVVSVVARGASKGAVDRAQSARVSATMLVLFLVAVTAAMFLLLGFLLIAVTVMDFDEFWDWFGAFKCWLWLPDWCWVVAVYTVEFLQDVFDWFQVVLMYFVLILYYLRFWWVVLEIAVVQTFPLTYLAFNGWLYN
jgi:hypothetical protein